MTRHFTRSSSQGFTATGLSLPQAPYTWACWFRVDTIPGSFEQYTLIGADNVTTNYEMLHIDSSARLAEQVTAGANNSVVSGVVAGKWHHAAMVASTSSSRVVWLDGKPGTTDTDSDAVTFTRL